MAERESFQETDDNAGGAGGDDYEVKARALDWVPKDEWKGDPDFWKPAKDYLEYAENALPVLKQNNKKLFGELQKRDAVVAQLQQTVNEQARIVKALSEASDTAVASQVEEKLASLRSSLVQANRDNDAELAATIQEELMDLKLEMKASKQTTGDVDLTKGDNQQPAMTAEDKSNWDDWVAANDWYKDPVMQAAATVIGSEIIREAMSNGGTAPKGRVLLDEVTKRMDNKFHITRGKGTDKVDGGSSTTGSTTSGAGKKYSSLPADAKAACEAQAKSRVGTGKRYPDLKSWQARFAEIYYSGE